MNRIAQLILNTILFIGSLTGANAQNLKNFPLDPFRILKTWHYEQIISNMGMGEIIPGRDGNPANPSGMIYSYKFLGMSGKLVFTIRKDSVSLIQFRRDHIERIVSDEMTVRMMQDTLVRWEYNREMQAMDSLRRDPVVRSINQVMGTPNSSGKTAAAEKNARYTAIWINRGYSCQYKDYLNFSEIAFTLPTIPSWAVGEFNIPAGTEIISKLNIKTRKIAWTASLLGFPSSSLPMAYSEYFLLLEFPTGQRFVENIPKRPADFLQGNLSLEFPNGLRTSLMVPNGATGFLPGWIFDDIDGDAIPDVRIWIPFDTTGMLMRHYVYSMPFREPHMTLSSGDLLPASVHFGDDASIALPWPDGTGEPVESAATSLLPGQEAILYPYGFRYLNTTRYSQDGSTNFLGGIELRRSPTAPPEAILEILYRHIPGGWEPGSKKILSIKD